MQNYKRKITYFYQYHNGNVGSTAGFLKLEIRGDKVKIIINIQEPPGLPFDGASLYFYHEAGDHLAALKVDRVLSRNGILTYQNRTDWQQMFDTGRDLYTFDGVAVVYNDSHYYIGDFMDRNRKDYKLVLKEKRQETAKEQKAGNPFTAGGGMTKPETAKQTGSGAERIQPDDRELQEETIGRKERETAQTGQDEVQRETAQTGRDEMQRETAQTGRDEMQREIPQTGYGEIPPEAAGSGRMEVAAELVKPLQGGMEKLNENMEIDNWEDMASPQQKKAADAGEPNDVKTLVESLFKKEDAARKKSPSSGGAKKDVYEKCENCPYYKKRMERKEQEDAFVKMLAEYPKLPVYGATELFQCVRIQPKDIGKLDMRNWKLGVNSFLTHGFYTYQYLLLGKMRFDDGSERPIIGVPGVFSNREKYLANMFGFEQFIPVKKTGIKTGEFGYWIVEISPYL